LTPSPKLFLASYALLLCLLAPLRPMWLDELLQLSDTYRHSLPETVARVAHNPGGVPLAYLAENVIVNAAGHPFYTAHLFSILCAAGGLGALIWLAKLLGCASGWIPAALLFAALPISLRYAVEARQYGPALAFSICATALLVWLDRRPDWMRTLIYGVVLALGMYSQPYVAFVVVAHLLWAMRRDSAKYTLAGCLFAALLFLPWYLNARGFWVEAVSDAGYRSSLEWKTPLMILRELSGGGYPLTLTLLVLAAYGWVRAGLSSTAKQLLLLWIAIPMPLILLADQVFHYFFAIRQFLFVIPPLCILAAEGLWSLRKSWRTATAVVLAAFALTYDVRWFTHYSEDWSIPVAAARKFVRPNTCILAIPASAADLYRLYEPSLPFCPEGGGNASIVLVSPYATPAQRESFPKLAFHPGEKMGGSTFFSANL